jgi:gliding motility-associated-like protein
MVNFEHMRAQAKTMVLILLTAIEWPQAVAQFIPNQGQFPTGVYAKQEWGNGNFWATKDGLIWHSWDPEAAQSMHDRSLETMSIPSHAIRLRFIGARWSQPEFKTKSSSTVYNYFKGSDPSHWARNVFVYNQLIFRNVYPNIDLELNTHSGGIKYNWIIHPDGNPEAIQFQYEGLNSLQVEPQELRLSTSLGEIVETIPLVYSVRQNGIDTLFTRYTQTGDTLGFSLNSKQIGRRFKQAVIDPVLVFSTYSGSKADNFGCTGTYDELGNGYAGGTVFDVGLPTTIGAFQIQFGGGVNENLGYGGSRDAAILKFNSAGTQLLYCTYLGGSNNEQPHSMVVDPAGNLFVMGSTRSTNFPSFSHSYKDKSQGDYDFFIAKFNSTGTQLLGSTYVGGSGLDAVGADRSTTSVNNFPLLYNYADEFRGEIICDSSRIYVSGVTYSINFPRSNNSLAFGGKEDAVLFCLSNNLDTLVWSQCYGGVGHDAFYGCALGKNGDLFAAGGTTSSSLENNGVSWKRLLGNAGNADAWIMRFNRNSGQALNGAYYSTPNYEQAYFVQTDNSGNPYIYGQHTSPIPAINARFHINGSGGQFITKLNPELNQVLLQSSFSGGGSNPAGQPNISPSAFLIDRCERIFVSGWGGETNDALYDIFTGASKTIRNKGNTRGLPVSADAPQRNTDGSDFYVAVFSKNMHDLAFATFFGGITSGFKVAEEHVDGGTSRFDKKGIIYQSVCAGCRRNGLFPTTPGAYSPTMKSDNCNNALFKIDFENLNKKPYMLDTFVKVTATQPIVFSKLAFDPDPYDTLELETTWLHRGGMKGADSAQVFVSSGIGSAGLTLIWNTTCNSFSSDTVTLRVMIRDRGCPQADTTYALIRILVEEPPKVIPPSAVCVSYDRKSGKMKVSWPSSTVPAGFFNYFLLERTNPDGSVIILDTIPNNQVGEWIDAGVIDPRNNNYCYALIGVNICGTQVRTQQNFCTVRELNNPITGVPVLATTVDNDKVNRTYWLGSEEPDFKEFEVYRTRRNGTWPDDPFLITTDTFALDSSLDVDIESWCYRVVVVDQCGHISTPSNEGCNVVISGSTVGTPQYYFNLNWIDYQGWNLGVNQWTLERMYSDKPFAPIMNGLVQRQSSDVNLDYDWGGYWYRVIAQEKKPAAQALSAQTSMSNWIYLFQKPEVWVPSGITIDGNGLNDVWGTVPVFVRGYSMKVYNRYGEKIWESNDKHRQWDGFYNDKQVPDGVYAWYLQFEGWDDKTYQKTGTVTVIH